MNSNVIDINKSNYYKRKATILVSGLITVIALLISFLLYSDYSILSINDKISQQNIDIINLRRILVDLDIQIKEFEDSKKLWSQINSKNQIRNGLDFDAVVSHGNVYGAQFHLEKSHHWGEKFLKNFLENC